MGWDELVEKTTRRERARGHLLARWFGGTSTLLENIVPLYRNANLRMKNVVEAMIARELKSGNYDAIYYRVVPNYRGDDPIPESLAIEVIGEKSDGEFVELFDDLILNDPSVPRTGL